MGYLLLADTDINQRIKQTFYAGESKAERCLHYI